MPYRCLNIRLSFLSGIRLGILFFSVIFILTASTPAWAGRVLAKTTDNQKHSRWPVPLDKRLTDEQIRSIKVYEIDLSTQPNVVVPKQTIKRFFKEYAKSQDVTVTPQDKKNFRQLEGYEQLALLFKIRARDLYDQVKVADDPPVIKKFRSSIELRYLQNYCGTTRCHGGSNPAGDFYLFRSVPESERTVYTNFYILTQYQNKQGKMIDRDQPRKSLLFQYALPRKLAKTPHPKVLGWRPHLIGPDTLAAENLLSFIKSLYTPTPDYGIKYTPPLPGQALPDKAAAASQPSSQPTKAE